MRKVFLMIGQPGAASPNAGLVESHSVGERFEAEFTKDEEKSLVDAGAIQVVGEVKSDKSASEPKADKAASEAKGASRK